jgi:hypothetical protein
VERIAASGPANFPVLTKTNYNDWSLLMKIKLEARGLWNAIDPGRPHGARCVVQCTSFRDAVDGWEQGLSKRSLGEYQDDEDRR